MTTPVSARARALPLLLVLLLCSPAFATQILLQTPAQMGRGSALVVQGRVLEVRSFWNGSGTKILTESTVQVTARHKGAAPAQVRVVQLGGVVDGVKMTVAGSLAWRPGEEVLLFLEDAGRLGYRVAGFSQGKFLVERDPVTGRAFVRRPALVETSVVDTPGGPAVPGADAAQRLPLDALLREALPQLREGR